jgi:hypothetical protein
MKQATVEAIKSGVDAIYGSSKAVADFLLLDDLRTVADENASYFDRGLAAAGFWTSVNKLDTTNRENYAVFWNERSY